MKAEVKVLHRARSMIEKSSEYFICTALVRAGNELRMHSASDRIRDVVMERLDGHRTLNYWLYRKHGIIELVPSQRFRLTRLAWIDDLIKEFS